jgi:hypothetical protein
MNNRIREIIIRDHRITPMQAEIWITVVPEHQAPTTWIGGRLMGPKCHYATTVEVGYYMDRLVREVVNAPGLTRRVIIPEPSLWEPQTPFYYTGFVNLMQDQTHVAGPVLISHGLRILTLGDHAWRLNSRSFHVHGVRRTELAEQDARQLRAEGVNTLVAPVSPTSARLWDDADRLGFFVIGEIADDGPSLQQALSLRRCASCLGWLIPPDWAYQELQPNGGLTKLVLDEDSSLGVWLKSYPSRLLPKWISFVASDERALENLRAVELPKLILRRENGSGMQEAQTPAVPADILGWIE